MYAFSMVEELPIPSKIVEPPITDLTGVKDRSVDTMWRKDMANLRRRRDSRTPWARLHPGQGAWDDVDAWEG